MPFPCSRFGYFYYQELHLARFLRSPKKEEKKATLSDCNSVLRIEYAITREMRATKAP